MNILRGSLTKNCVVPLSSSSIWCQQTRLATKKAGGSSRNGRDSAGRRLGLKKFGGEEVIPGNIIIRQRGQKYHSGTDTKMGRDHTIYAVAEGWVKFVYNKIQKHQIVTVTNINPNTPKKIHEIVEGEESFRPFHAAVLALRPRRKPVKAVRW